MNGPLDGAVLVRQREETNNSAGTASALSAHWARHDPPDSERKKWILAGSVWPHYSRHQPFKSSPHILVTRGRNAAALLSASVPGELARCIRNPALLFALAVRSQCEITLRCIIQLQLGPCSLLSKVVPPTAGRPTPAACTSVAFCCAQSR